jgi:hypothetical protein
MSWGFLHAYVTVNNLNWNLKKRVSTTAHLGDPDGKPQGSRGPSGMQNRNYVRTE